MAMCTNLEVNDQIFELAKAVFTVYECRGVTGTSVAEFSPKDVSGKPGAWKLDGLVSVGIVLQHRHVVCDWIAREGTQAIGENHGVVYLHGRICSFSDVWCVLV